MEKFNIVNLLRDNIKKMQPYSSARDEFTGFKKEMVFLDANENPYRKSNNRYPDPYQLDLKKAISELKNIDASQILIGNGSDEVLDLMYRAFCEPGKDNVITLPPTYGMYSVLAQINNIENKEVPLVNGFQLDLEGIVNAINENTKLIFICSPNNPTGNTMSVATIVKLLEIFNGILVIDEAYIDFSTQDSLLSKLENYPNLVIIQTLSKAWGLAGIRIGILYGSQTIIKILNQIKPPYNINSLSQQYALKKMKDLERVKSDIHKINKGKLELNKQLKQIAWVKKIYPSDANFILIAVDDANLRYQQLIAKNIVIRNRNAVSLCENCLRITIGNNKENKQLITIIKTL